jgi:hypothetical protein
MTVAIFHDDAGRITFSAELDSLTADDIADQTPVDGGYIVADDFPDESVQWVDSGALEERPTLEVDLVWQIASDGVDSVWFEAPEDTNVNVIPADGDLLLATGTMPADGYIAFRSVIAGEYVLDVDPPFPYQQTKVSVSAGGEVDTPTEPPDDPELEITLQMDALTGLSGDAKPKFNIWSWDESTNPRHSHYDLTFYETEEDADDDTNGNDVGPILETFYQDREEVAIDDGLWARVSDIDLDGNRSAKSDWATVVVRGVETEDIDDFAVVPRKADLGDPYNTIKDNNLLDVTLFTATAVGNATVTGFTSVLNVSPQLGSSRNKLRVSFSTVEPWYLPGTAKVRTLPINPCEAGKRYTFSGIARAVTLGGGALKVRLAINIHWYGLDSDGDPVPLTPDPVFLDLADATTSVSGSAVGKALAPAGACLYALEAEVTPLTPTAIGNYVVEIGGLAGKEATVGVFELNEPSGTVTIAATATGTPLWITSNHSKAAQSVTISWCFKNASGGSRAFTVEWWKTPEGGTATKMTGRTYSLQDDNPLQLEYLDQAPTGASTYYECRVVAGGSALTLGGRVAISKGYF